MHILDLSVSAYEAVVWMAILYIAYLTTVGTYLIRTTYLYTFSVYVILISVSNSKTLFT